MYISVAIHSLTDEIVYRQIGNYNKSTRRLYVGGFI